MIKIWLIQSEISKLEARYERRIDLLKLSFTEQIEFLQEWLGTMTMENIEMLQDYTYKWNTVEDIIERLHKEIDEK